MEGGKKIQKILPIDSDRLLRVAIGGLKVDVCQDLLDSGTCNANQFDADIGGLFSTPLLHAFMCWEDTKYLGYYTIIYMLITHKSFKVNYIDTFTGLSPLKCVYMSNIPNREHLIGLLLEKGAKCKNWQYWSTKDGYMCSPQPFILKWCGVPLKPNIMQKWRSYLPEWSIFSHKVYPKEFDNLAVTCMLLFNKLNTSKGYKIPKDIKLLLITHVAENWKTIVDKI